MGNNKGIANFCVTVLIGLLVAGCSGGGNIPVFPGQLVINEEKGNAGNTLLGEWVIEFELGDLTATVMPSREPDLHYNVTHDIPPPKIEIQSYDGLTEIMVVQVTLKNPLAISGYDVRGIIYTNGGYKLLNPDGWTGLFDIAGGDNINPFIAFAKNLPNRIFPGKSEQKETFEIYLPYGDTDVRFAVTASYPDNCEEPYEFGEFSQAELHGSVLSTAEVSIEVLDWQEDVEEVYIECPDIAGEPPTPLMYVSGNTWAGNLENVEAATEGEYGALITASSGGFELFTKVTIKVLPVTHNIGLIQNSDEVTPGYVLFQPMEYEIAYLINNEGLLVHSWETDGVPDLVVYLLENGNLLKTVASPGHGGGKVQEVDWDGNVVWEYLVDGDPHTRHHDVERMPNGNTLIIAWDWKSELEAFAAGRRPELLPAAEMWPDSVLEVNHAGEIVWLWNSWDHLACIDGGVANGKPVSTDITDPGKLNINVPGGGVDWLHLNAVDYNLELDHIILSSPTFSEIFIIDHATADYDNPQAGIDAAAGPAGDLIYRWGNPQNYVAGGPEDRKFYNQHDGQWIEPGCPGEGNILVFNNGKTRVPPYASVDSIIPLVTSEGNYSKPSPGYPFGPDEQNWIYTADPVTDFMAPFISGATRLQNGNTLICAGPTGWFFEINPDDEVIWQYINPVGMNGPEHQGTNSRSNVFRCYRYAPDYPGFAGRDLTPGDPIELP